MQAVTFPLLLLRKRVTMSQFCLRLEHICAKYQHSLFLLLRADEPHDLSCQSKDIFFPL